MEAWPARGGAPTVSGNRYQISAGGGVVSDNWTKLQWQRAGVANKQDLAIAESYCSGLSLEGSGWRLPTVRELHGLVDEQESAPAIDTTAFPNTAASSFHFSSPRAGWKLMHWYVNFGYGSADPYGTPGEVRCVRGN